VASGEAGLRTLLGLVAEDDAAVRLAREGGHAFVSASLRPYLIAALAEVDRDEPARPTLVVVGDDRAARDLAGDLRAWLAPRRVRYYPSRGVAYESHLAPPPHLVGLRVAALDALLGAQDAVVVVSAVALSEKVPDPALRPHSFTLRVGELLDLDECAAELVGAGYERVEQVEERGQFAMRGGLLDVFPATEERAVRVDMFDVEIESLRWFSTFTQRSLGDVQEVEIAPAAELALEHRELAELAAEQMGAASGAPGVDAERPDIAELLPVERFRALLDLVGEQVQLVVGAEEDLEPVLNDHWSDVCAAFADEDAHHLYVDPQSIHATLADRVRIWLSAHSAGQEIELRAQSADTAARSLAEAEPELEKLVRSGYRTVVAFPRRGEGERAAYNLGRLKATWLEQAGGGDADAANGAVAGGAAIARQPLEPSLRFVAASLREGSWRRS
jgi:transcription-repair coupling factor (superfamily II helicase)